jgi:hypothetical protein
MLGKTLGCVALLSVVMASDCLAEAGNCVVKYATPVYAEVNYRGECGRIVSQLPSSEYDTFVSGPTIQCRLGHKTIQVTRLWERDYLGIAAPAVGWVRTNSLATYSLFDRCP